MSIINGFTSILVEFIQYSLIPDIPVKHDKSTVKLHCYFPCRHLSVIDDCLVYYIIFDLNKIS